MSTVEEKKGEAYKRWYRKNAAAFNLARKAKYHNDPEVRATAIERQRAQREKNKDRPRNPDQLREVGGKQVKVVRIGELCAMVDRFEKTIRNWEARGYIPKPTVPGTHRYYTMNQVSLIREFSDLVNEVGRDKELRDYALGKKVAEITLKWGNV